MIGLSDHIHIFRYNIIKKEENLEFTTKFLRNKKYC